MIKLDLKDRKILFALEDNARQSDQEVARKVRLSRESVRYRIHQMQKNGYINYFMTLINTMKLGYDWYRTFFKFQNVTLEKEEEMIGWLKTRASWITRVEGIWDLNTAIFCKNVYQYRDIMNEFLMEYSKFVEKYNVAIVTRMWIYKKNYLLYKTQKNVEPIVMGFNSYNDRQVEVIDDIDYGILGIVMKNARMKNSDIARRMNITEMMVRYRIRKLVEKGIIIGFRPFLNIPRLGYIYFKIHFTLQNLTAEKKREIFTYMHQHPSTAHTTELVGGSDLETEFQVTTNQEFYDHIRQIRTMFGDLIKDYEFMQYTNEYKFTYLPERDMQTYAMS